MRWDYTSPEGFDPTTLAARRLCFLFTTQATAWMRMQSKFWPQEWARRTDDETEDEAQKLYGKRTPAPYSTPARTAPPSELGDGRRREQDRGDSGEHPCGRDH